MKKGIIMANLLSLLLSFFNCKPKTTIYPQADIYKDLRNQAFSVTPKMLSISSTTNTIVFGIIMETGYPEAVASLIAMGDGSVSLYYSNGGGIIGIGEHHKPRNICFEYISESNKYIKYCNKSESNSLPTEGETIFYFLTNSGIYYYKEKENTLGNNNSTLSPLFHKAHELITEAILIDKKRNNNPESARPSHN